jgi:hypothetical protein
VAGRLGRPRDGPTQRSGLLFGELQLLLLLLLLLFLHLGHVLLHAL